MTREKPTLPENHPRRQAADRVVDAYSAVLGRPVLTGTKARLHDQAMELLTAGLPEAWLTERVRELPERGWTDLVQHVERSSAPVPGQQQRRTGAASEEEIRAAMAARRAMGVEL